MENMTITGQEKVTGALSYIVFFLPLLLSEKTDFTLFHARQSFGIFLLWTLGFILSYIPFIGGLLSKVLFIILAIMSIFLAIKAYQGERFLVP